MARDALPSRSTASAISSFKRQPPSNAASPKAVDRKAPCPHCKKPFLLFSQGAYGWNTRPHQMCIECYRGRRRTTQTDQTKTDTPKLEVASIISQVTSISCMSPSPHYTKQRRGLRKARHSKTNPCNAKPFHISHHIFSSGEWRKVRCMDHPKVTLSLSVKPADYKSFSLQCPSATPTTIYAMADSGAIVPVVTG